MRKNKLPFIGNLMAFLYPSIIKHLDEVTFEHLDGIWDSQ